MPIFPQFKLFGLTLIHLFSLLIPTPTSLTWQVAPGSREWEGGNRVPSSVTQRNVSHVYSLNDFPWLYCQQQFCLFFKISSVILVPLHIFFYAVSLSLLFSKNSALEAEVISVKECSP